MLSQGEHERILRIHKAEMAMDIEKHRVNAICALIKEALVNESVEMGKLKVLLEYIHLALPPSSIFKLSE